MLLLNADQITKSVSERTLLDIQPFDSASLGPSFYYFGLGQHYCRFDGSTGEWRTYDLHRAQDETLIVSPGEFLLVRSHERFWCSLQCMGVIGARSTMTRRGLSLQHSPFIDPSFPDSNEVGYLELGIKNELSQAVRLGFKERIGKVSFFNIAESNISASCRNPSQTDFKRRAGSDKPVPLYDDDPVEGWEGVEQGATK